MCRIRAILRPSRSPSCLSGGTTPPSMTRRRFWAPSRKPGRTPVCLSSRAPGTRPFVLHRIWCVSRVGRPLSPTFSSSRENRRLTAIEESSFRRLAEVLEIALARRQDPRGAGARLKIVIPALFSPYFTHRQSSMRSCSNTRPAFASAIEARRCRMFDSP